MTNKTSTLEVPIIVGVTGHRDLHPDHVEALREQVRAEFEDLLHQYPHTPILVLSPLGEGADRLVAEVATEMGDRVKLVAVLPWPREFCPEMLHRTGNRAEFDALLEKAEYSICVPLEDEVDGADLCESEDSRQVQYATVGRYIAKHCQILFALWDGVEDKRGQTWQVIRWQAEGVQAPFATRLGFLDEPEAGPFVHFQVVRAGRPGGGEPGEPKWNYPVEFARRFPEIAANLERFNRDVANLHAKLAPKMEEARGYVFPTDEQKKFGPRLRFLLDRFAIADSLAMHYQRYCNYLMVGVLVVILLTVASFECYAHLDPGNMGLMFGYFLFFGGGTTAVFLARRNRLYRRYLDYRALAEAVRVHLFWKLAGLEESAADYYLRSFRSPLDWSRLALRSWNVESGEHDCDCPKEDDCALPPDERLRMVRERWIENQMAFFRKKAPWNEKARHRWHLAARVFLFVSLALAAVQGVRLLAAAFSHEHLGHDHVTHYLIIGIALCGVVAGLAHEYADRRAFEKQARSYKSMASLYDRALKTFDQFLESKDHRRIRQLIRELGGEALVENADWVIYHRERPPEFKH